MTKKQYFDEWMLCTIPIPWSKYTTSKDVFVNLLFGVKSLGLAPDSLMGESRPDKIVIFLSVYFASWVNE